jgi:multicomponent Na+:H+ antiporter subunit F
VSIDVALSVIGIVLGLAAVPCVARIILGPTILDRAVGSDMLVMIVVSLLALYCVVTDTTYPVVSMIALAAFAFIGTLALARFVSREDQRCRELDGQARHPGHRHGTLRTRRKEKAGGPTGPIAGSAAETSVGRPGTDEGRES